MARPGNDCEWEDRLQDWIDGDLRADESEAVLAHAARCASRRARIDALCMLDNQLARSLPRLALDDDFNRRVLTVAASISRDLASARARLERDWLDQESALLRVRRRIRNRILLDVLALSLVTVLATTFWPMPDSEWLDGTLSISDPASSLSLSLAAISTVVAFAIVGLLAATERD